MARIRASHNVPANQTYAKRKHMECRTKRMRNYEQCVQDLVTCMNEFDSLPFDPASPTIRTLQSAMLASRKLVADLNSACAAGEGKLTSFLRERLFSKNTTQHTRQKTTSETCGCWQGKAQVPNTYMKLADLSSCQNVQNAAM